MDFETRSYKIEFISELLGSTPKDPEVYRSYIETKKPETQTEEEYLTVEKIEEKGWTGFHKDENGLFIYDYTVRGFLKSAGEAVQLKTASIDKKTGEAGTKKLTAIKSKIDKFVFVFPRRIYLGKQEPDGVIERPLRAMTMQGPRVTLARSDYIKAGLQIGFDIILIKNTEITWRVVDQLFSYSVFSGLGQFRNGSYGRFKILEWV